MRTIFAALALSAAALTAASAEEVAPAAAHVIDLGAVGGVAYYTVAPEGYRVVATLAGTDGAPVRVTATLAPEQRLDLSVPGAVGEAETAVTFVRSGNTLAVVHEEIAAY